jgi:hypothetical protein
VKVLFVAGWQRSGTTVIGNVLGSAPSAVHIGELHYLWMKEHPAGFECGCGTLLWDCALWSAVLRRLDMRHEEREAVGPLRAQAWHNAHAPARYWDWRRGRPDLGYPEVLGRVYRTLTEESGARLIVDSTKNASDALAAALAPGIDLHLLHVVRDPRAAAHSGMRQKVHGSHADGLKMKQFSPSRTAVHWNMRNVLIERCARPVVAPDRYLRVRYEDLMRSPREAFGHIADWTGLDRDELPFVAESTIRLTASHTVMGNPNRHTAGRELTLRPDSRWLKDLRTRDAWAATVLAGPLLPHYGYRYRPRAGDHVGQSATRHR